MMTDSRPQQLAAINAKAAALTTAKVHLLMATLAPTPDTPLASFTAHEATFTGYAATTVGALGAAYIDPITGDYLADGVALSWTMTDTVSPNTIYGAFIADSGATKVLAYEMFATPIPLSLAGQGLSYVPVVHQP